MSLWVIILIIIGSFLILGIIINVLKTVFGIVINVLNLFYQSILVLSDILIWPIKKIFNKRKSISN